MSPDESEHGWSTTVALRYNIRDNITGFAEALNVRSRRGVRATSGSILSSRRPCSSLG